MYSDLNQQQAALHDFMSNISEEGWAAGWMDGLEYELWHMVLHGPAQYGFKFIDEQTIQQLKYLSEQANGWIVFDDTTEESAVSLSDWERMFIAADPSNFDLKISDLGE